MVVVVGVGVGGLACLTTTTTATYSPLPRSSLPRHTPLTSQILHNVRTDIAGKYNTRQAARVREMIAAKSGSRRVRPRAASQVAGRSFRQPPKATQSTGQEGGSWGGDDRAGGGGEGGGGRGVRKPGYFTVRSSEQFGGRFLAQEEIPLGAKRCVVWWRCGAARCGVPLPKQELVQGGRVVRGAFAAFGGFFRGTR